MILSRTEDCTFREKKVGFLPHGKKKNCKPPPKQREEKLIMSKVRRNAKGEQTRDGTQPRLTREKEILIVNTKGGNGLPPMWVKEKTIRLYRRKGEVHDLFCRGGE